MSVGCHVKLPPGQYLLMFRKIVRKVILKRFWQAMFDKDLSLDQTRNTNTVFRRIGHKEILFEQERRYLAKPFVERDVVQKKIAELIVTRLKCLEVFEPVRQSKQAQLICKAVCFSRAYGENCHHA